MFGSVWTTIIAAAGLGCLVAWFYGIYHSVALAVMRWHAAPNRAAALREIFRSPRGDRIAGALPERYLIHRTRSRRGLALFLGFWLVGMAAIVMDVWSAGWHATPAQDRKAAK